MADIFDSSVGYSGFYGPTSGSGSSQVAITIKRATGSGTTTGSNVTADDGFLVDSYNVQWTRPIQTKRVFNKQKPIAIVGYGTGGGTLTGIIGTKAGFLNLLGASSGTKTADDICNPLTIIIDASNGFNLCSATGTTTVSQGCKITLSGVVVSSVNIAGQIMENGQTLQTGTVSFTASGMSID